MKARKDTVLQGKSPRQAYTLGLALIAVLVTLQFIGLRFAASQQQLSAAEINLSGRQRMVSQRIAWMMSELRSEVGSDDVTPVRAMLAACTDLMARSHNALQRRTLEEIRTVLADGSFCLGDSQTEESALVDNLTEIVEPSLLADFLQSAWEVANNQSTPAETELGFSIKPVSALLQRLNAETLKAQEVSTERLSMILALNWALILALVVGELFLIFRPMARTVDNTLRKLGDANDELSESEKRLKDFATTGAHQFWETDQQHRFTWIETSDPVTETRPQEINIGREPWRIHRVDASDGDWGSLRDAMLAHEPFMSFEYSMTDSAGNQTRWRSHGKPVFSKHGDFLGYRGTSQEITREYDIASQHRRSERMRAIGQLSAGVAHDFNNILAVIQANAELSVPDAPSNRLKESLQEIIAATEQASALTSRLLSFGRIQRLSREPIELQPFMDDLARLFDRTLGENFSIRMQHHVESLWVMTDRHQLEDACLNLALNARDAGESGTLVVSTDVVDASMLLPDSRLGEKSSQYVQITFSDTGCGMSEVVRDQVFEPFFTTKQSQGSGLGLSMVYGFVRQSDGLIQIESSPGVGTDIHLFLPRHTGTQISAKGSRRGETPLIPAGWEGMHALLVEDNFAVSKAIRKQLGALGFIVEHASCGADALERLQAGRRFDIVILDILLRGGLDGIEVYEQMVQIEPSLKALFCSGFAGMETTDNKSHRIPGELLKKPFGIAALTSALHRVLDAHGTPPIGASLDST